MNLRKKIKPLQKNGREKTRTSKSRYDKEKNENDDFEDLEKEFDEEEFDLESEFDSVKSKVPSTKQSLIVSNKGGQLATPDYTQIAQKVKKKQSGIKK